MIVQRFLAWVETAPAGARAEATSALGRAYLYSDLDDRDRADAEVALTSMLDDPSPLVRRALAEAFASALDAPHHCVVALACDQSDIAAIVLSRSPVLTDAELVDCAAVGDAVAQAAIALRPRLSAGVAAALAEICGREAAIVLAVNTGAATSDCALRRLIERFGADGEVREAILARPGLSPALRADLVLATARALSDFVVGRDWMSEERAQRISRDSVEKSAVLIGVEIAGRAGAATLDLVRRLRRGGQLTPSLALRALLSGARGLFIAMLADLTGLPPGRVASLVNRPEGSGFAALYTKARLPPALLPAFRAALSAGAGVEEPAGRLSRAMVERVRRLCETAPGEEAARLLSALRRLESEAAREDARAASGEFARRLPQAPAIPVPIEAGDIGDHREVSIEDAIAAELMAA